jgi:hypothetical protein
VPDDFVAFVHVPQGIQKGHVVFPPLDRLNPKVIVGIKMTHRSSDLSMGTRDAVDFSQPVANLDPVRPALVFLHQPRIHYERNISV